MPDTASRAEVMVIKAAPAAERRLSTSRLVSLGLLLAAACLLPFSLSPFVVFQFTQVLVYSMALLGLNMLTGYNGQISLGHGAFFALGAYTTAIMIDRWHVPYGWTLPVAGILDGRLAGHRPLQAEGAVGAAAEP